MLGAGGSRPLLSWPLTGRAVGGSSRPHVARKYVCVQERVSVWVCALDSAVTRSRDPSFRPALLLRPRPLEVREGEHEDQYGAREHLLLGDTRSCPSSLPRA